MWKHVVAAVLTIALAVQVVTSGLRWWSAAIILGAGVLLFAAIRASRGHPS